MSDNILDFTLQRSKRIKPRPRTHKKVGLATLGRVYRSDVVYPEKFVMVRELHGYTHEDVAAASGLSVEEVASFESGEASPTIEQLGNLAFALKFPPAFFCHVPVDFPSIEQTSLAWHEHKESPYQFELQQRVRIKLHDKKKTLEGCVEDREYDEVLHDALYKVLGVWYWTKELEQV